LLIAVLMTLSAVASAATFNKSTYQPAQNKDSLSGKYEGVAKSDQIGDIPLTVEIKNDNGKLTGKIETPQGPAAITGGTFDNGKIVMKFDAGGNEGTVTATLDGDKISGKWELAGQGGGLELKRAAMVASAPASSAGGAAKPAAPAAAPATAGDPLTGEWDAAADANGTEFPFTLKLKLEGDRSPALPTQHRAQRRLAGHLCWRQTELYVDTPTERSALRRHSRTERSLAILILRVR
jgi:hypothetical protein